MTAVVDDILKKQQQIFLRHYTHTHPLVTHMLIPSTADISETQIEFSLFIIHIKRYVIDVTDNVMHIATLLCSC